MVDDEMTIPVTIITGFLGSGKTTLLNHVLQHPSFNNSLVIVNEFGDVGIDHLLVSAPAENMRLLSNGCLCCEVLGGLVETLTDISQKRASGAISTFDRVLIETSGLADPVPIIHTLVTNPDLGDIFRLDRVVGVVDAVHAVSQIATQDEARKQIAVSDVLLLSKTDLVAESALEGVQNAVKSINAGAELIPVVQGQINPELLFGPDSAQRRSVVPEVERWLGSHIRVVPARGIGIRSSSHAGDVRTFTLFHDAPTSASALTTWFGLLSAFRGPNLLRLKGIVNVDGDPYVIHAVQTIFHEPVLLDHWPSDDRRTRIVFIGRSLDRDAITKTFATLAESGSTWKSPRMDPSTYERFLEVAQQIR
jgi:G3E family GTPase